MTDLKDHVGRILDDLRADKADIDRMIKVLERFQKRGGATKDVAPAMRGKKKREKKRGK